MTLTTIQVSKKPYTDLNLEWSSLDIQDMNYGYSSSLLTTIFGFPRPLIYYHLKRVYSKKIEVFQKII
jgi:hypothetical protein